MAGRSGKSNVAFGRRANFRSLPRAEVAGRLTNVRFGGRQQAFPVAELGRIGHVAAEGRRKARTRLAGEPSSPPSTSVSRSDPPHTLSVKQLTRSRASPAGTDVIYDRDAVDPRARAAIRPGTLIVCLGCCPPSVRARPSTLSWLMSARWFGNAARKRSAGISNSMRSPTGAAPPPCARTPLRHRAGAAAWRGGDVMAVAGAVSLDLRVGRGLNWGGVSIFGGFFGGMADAEQRREQVTPVGADDARLARQHAGRISRREGLFAACTALCRSGPCVSPRGSSASVPRPAPAAQPRPSRLPPPASARTHVPATP